MTVGPVDNEGIRVQRAPNCYCCGRAGRLLYRNLRDRWFFAPGQWSIRRCGHCRLAWIDPRPAEEEIPRLYGEYYTHDDRRKPGRESGRNLVERLRSYAIDSILESDFGYRGTGGNAHLGRLFSLCSVIKDDAARAVMWLRADRGKRLLDVGCGSGEFLRRMQRLGWSVEGVEPDPEAARTARGCHVSVHAGTLEDAALASDGYDAVTMTHVVEHLPDPVGTLRECHRILRAGGQLVIATPNIQSLGARVLRGYWRGWEPPRHLFLFSPAALRKLCGQAGFNVELAETSALIAGFIWLFSRTGTSRPPTRRVQGMEACGLVAESVAFLLVEYLLNISGTFGEEVIVVARKPAVRSGREPKARPT